MEWRVSQRLNDRQKSDNSIGGIKHEPAIMLVWDIKWGHAYKT